MSQATAELMEMIEQTKEWVDQFEWDRRKGETPEQALKFKQRRKTSIAEAAQQMLIEKSKTGAGASVKGAAAKRKAA